MHRTLQAIAQQEESHRNALAKIQQKEQAVHRAEINLRQVEGERVRAEMEAVMDEVGREEEQQCIEDENSMTVQMSYEEEGSCGREGEEEYSHVPVRTEGVGSREDREQTDEIEQMTEGVWSQEQEDEPGHQATERELCVGCDLEEELGCDSEEELDCDSEEDLGHDSEEELGRDSEEELDCDSEEELGCDSEEELGRDSEDEAEQEFEADADELCCIREENKHLRRRLEAESFGFKMIEGNDEKTRFYTGLPAWAVFLHLFLFLAVPSTTVTKLVPENELFLVLVRLRLGLLVEDLATRFCVTKSFVSRVFQKWLDVMYIRLSFLIAWPERDMCKQNMPMCFKEAYPNCRCVIDCSEIFIETPQNFSARAKTYSNYKKHNTIKFLIGITPFGTISFLSDCWGGRVSDKNLTQCSKFFDLLERGDTILADRGFTIGEDLGVFGVKLEVPSFTRGKKQLSQRDVEHSKNLSHVRIHVERVIGLVKNKFLILKGPLPISFIKHKGDKNVANIDKVLTVCCALTNMSASIVQ